MLLDPPIPFGHCPDKGKRKTVYVYKGCEVKAYWQEKQYIHHINVVVSVNAAFTSLPPFFLSTRQTTDKDLDDTFFRM